MTTAQPRPACIPHSGWMSFIRAVLGLAAVVVLNLPGPALAQENADCLMCHEDPELKGTRNGTEASMFVDPAQFQGSVHGALDCINCHTDLEGVELPSQRRARAGRLRDLPRATSRSSSPAARTPRPSPVSPATATTTSPRPKPDRGHQRRPRPRAVRAVPLGAGRAAPAKPPRSCRRRRRRARPELRHLPLPPRRPRPPRPRVPHQHRQHPAAVRHLPPRGHPGLDPARHPAGRGSSRTTPSRSTARGCSRRG